MKNYIDVIQSNVSGGLMNEKEIINLESIKGRSKSSKINKFASKDVILYALSVGVSTSCPSNLKFLYENHDQFSILPTYAVIPSLEITFDLMKDIFAVPHLNLDLSQLLHGEQYLEMLKPLQMNEELKAHAEIVDVIDKIRGALVLVDVNLSNVNNEIICKSQLSLFLNGAGGFNGKRSSDKAIPVTMVPRRSPEKVVEKYIGIDQATLYRLNGDLNPLHIDPEFAQLAGFNRPIIHGLYLFGLVAHEALRLFGSNDVNNFHKMKVRFSQSVTPGETLIIEFWEDSLTVNFQCKVKGSDKICLHGGFIQLNLLPPNSKRKGV